MKPLRSYGKVLSPIWIPSSQFLFEICLEQISIIAISQIFNSRSEIVFPHSLSFSHSRPLSDPPLFALSPLTHIFNQICTPHLKRSICQHGSTSTTPKRFPLRCSCTTNLGQLGCLYGKSLLYVRISECRFQAFPLIEIRVLNNFHSKKMSHNSFHGLQRAGC